MTVKLYDDDAHLKRFDAVVLRCTPHENGFAAVLNQTAFFPEGGGQQSDRGTLGAARVTDVQIADGEIVHYTDAPLTEGTTVTGEIDWNRRFAFMQNHSGEHIVSGIVHSLYGYDNVGFHLGDGFVTLDFNGLLSEEQLRDAERRANEVVWKNAEFRAYYPTEAELATLQYRSKKALDGAVRIVEIAGYDRCACCAPHVRSAAEIGMIKLLDTEKMRGGIRILMKCGLYALDDYCEKQDNLRRIGNLLSAKQADAADAVGRLAEQSDAQKQENAALKKRLITALIAAGTQETAVFAEGLDGKELQLFADGLYRKNHRLAAVFSPLDKNHFSFAICGDADETDRLLPDFKAAFPVRGGGRNGMLQGTVEAAQNALNSYFHFDR